MAVFVGDCFLVELAESCASAFGCINEIFLLCGFKLDKGKEHHPSAHILLLGAQISIDRAGLTASVPEDRRNALIAELEKVLKAGTLTPGLAAKIRGKLGFAQSLMYGRYGRVQLQPLTSRQFSRAVKGRHPLNRELIDVLP